jgi:heme a synthase
LTASHRHSRFVQAWLCAVAAAILLTVLVGGGTRLTESGLSIVEWRPVTGVVPPLSEARWDEEFAKYRTIPQYQTQNRGMTLSEFKTIYWWEWAHRLMGRLVGAVFLLPFLFFLWRGWIEPRLRWRLWLIFALGGVQGAVGWWMVTSGLAERTSVSQYRLAFHLTLACVIHAAVVWIISRMSRTQDDYAAPRRIRWGALVLMGLVVVQIYLGALVAGLDAGLTYATWPLMDGQIIPAAEQLLLMRPAWRNVFENVLTVQFNHRMVAYLLWLAALLHALDAWRNASRRVGTVAAVLAAGVTVQAMIGIVTLLYGVPIGLGLLHQAGAVLVLTIAVVHAEALTRKEAYRTPHASEIEPTLVQTPAAGMN